MSSIAISNYIFRNSTDAEFRLWGKAVGDQLVAGGWVRTTDTGQINWTTVLAPAAINTVSGYEIFRSNDGTGAYDQIYVKLEYGSNAGLASQPQVWMTVGFGSDGAGSITSTLTSPSSGRLALSTNTSQASSANPIYICAGAGYFVVSLGVQTVNTILTIHFSIERTRDSTGAFQNEVLIVNSYPTAQFRNIVLHRTAGLMPDILNLGYIILASNHIQAGKVGLSVLLGQRAGWTNPSLNIMGVVAGALGPSGATLYITTNGVSRLYMINSTSSFGFFSTGYSLLTRFD